MKNRLLTEQKLCFSNVGQWSRSRSRVQNLCFHLRVFLSIKEKALSQGMQSCQI